MEEKIIRFTRKVTKEEEGLYLTVPFLVPQGVESMEIHYEYETSDNIIDFGMVDEKGQFIGWSGSNRSTLFLSERESSSGFACLPMREGEWKILLGAYKVKDEGVDVFYQVTFQFKHLRLLKGDTHVHSCGSDGVMTTEELAFLAKKEGLDYLFITDHNNYAHNESLPHSEKVTMIPGVEWTHYKGHAGMLGRKRPFKNFISNSLEETKERLREAKEEGACVVLNHPFCPYCGWKWGMDEVEYDAVEVWNTALAVENNMACLNWWDKRLKEGKRIPITGGSDFHRLEQASMPAAPCTCVYAMSNSPGDILEAIKTGHCFLSISPEGPMMEATSEEKIIGDIMDENNSIKFSFWNLKAGDKLRLITESTEEEIICEEEKLTFEKEVFFEKYLRVEVLRSLIGGLPQIPVLIANPFYKTE